MKITDFREYLRDHHEITRPYDPYLDYDVPAACFSATDDVDEYRDVEETMRLDGKL